MDWNRMDGLETDGWMDGWITDGGQMDGQMDWNWMDGLEMDGWIRTGWRN